MDIGVFNHISVESLYERLDSRWNSKHELKKYIHRIKFEKLLSHLTPGETLLDIGRGGSVDGVLGVLAAKKGLKVTISNVTQKNLLVIRKFAEEQGVIDEITFIECMPFDIPVPDNCFDNVIALHILEHLPNFEAGLQEIKRVSNKKAIIALPTCLNFCAISRLGGAHYFEYSWKSPFALIYGTLRLLIHAVRGDDGVEEDMEEFGVVTKHMWRFPWKMRAALIREGFIINKFGPDALPLPWFNAWLPLIRKLDRYGYAPLLREFGMGSHAIVEKINQKNYGKGEFQ
ncbi:methyltransferase domain-containing protein [Paenibacillus thailandensis]|uniref:Methyltransferase domain-containing protein n=1 Tax=Paenibacillus thailandensis TaxID=393250 RepID=A0ABW5QZ68_9BACL